MAGEERMKTGESLNGERSDADASKMAALSDAVERAVSAVTALAAEMERFTGEIREAAGLADSGGVAAGGESDATTAGKSAGAASLAGSEGSSGLVSAGDTLKTHREAVLQVTAAYEGLDKTCRSFAGSAAREIADFATDSKRSVSEMVEAILRDLLRLTLYRSVTQPLSQWISGLTGGAGSGVEGAVSGYSAAFSGGVGVSGTAVVSAAAATGGSGAGDGGESGAAASGKAESGAPVSVTVNLHNETGVPVKAVQRSMSHDAHNTVIGMVLQSYEEGGDVWRMIRGQKK